MNGDLIGRCNRQTRSYRSRPRVFLSASHSLFLSVFLSFCNVQMRPLIRYFNLRIPVVYALTLVSVKYMSSALRVLSPSRPCAYQPHPPEGVLSTPDNTCVAGGKFLSLSIPLHERESTASRGERNCSRALGLKSRTYAKL